MNNIRLIIYNDDNGDTSLALHNSTTDDVYYIENDENCILSFAKFKDFYNIISIYELKDKLSNS